VNNTLQKSLQTTSASVYLQPQNRVLKKDIQTRLAVIKETQETEDK